MSKKANVIEAKGLIYKESGTDISMLNLMNQKDINVFAVHQGD